VSWTSSRLRTRRGRADPVAPQGRLHQEADRRLLARRAPLGGYDIVYTPHIAKLDLWKTSGHTEYYRANMLLADRDRDVEYQLKPMNCPFHLTIFKSRLKSYRDLPIRYAELGTVYRFERSGVLHGSCACAASPGRCPRLLHPRSARCEIVRVLDFVTNILRTFGFTKYDIYLSTRPSRRAGRTSSGRRPPTRSGRRSSCGGCPTRWIRRGRVLRAQDRHQDQGFARPRLAVLDDPADFHNPTASGSSTSPRTARPTSR